MLKRILLVLFISATALPSFSEDGSRLWLRYDTVSVRKQIDKGIDSPVMRLAENELSTFWKGGKVSLQLMADSEYFAFGKDGYTINVENGTTVLRSMSETGLLYAAYHLLRLQACGEDCSRLDIKEKPVNDIRILNHWDNPDGTIERGYAGRSLWKWDELPAKVSPRYAEYARANASIGINGTVLNNVNASPEALSSDNLKKVKTLADIFRPYGIKVYLSVNFATPIKLGGLATADPLNSDVAEWWKQKVHEIYSMIPDFGGFLVKANSEGQPGPCDYHRTHAEGANMLASALKPYGGIVMWRAFVYSPSDADRAKQAYLEFKPLDGKFLDNVIVQVKNGPIDFQPREPYSPLFGAMPHTQLMVEFQVTQEYLGHSNHLAYLAPMWKEFYSYYSPSNMKAAAGVTNIGDDTNWCGNDFAQSNWYAFGRLAWNPALSSEEIAREWLAQTFTADSRFVRPMTEVMMQSREAVVDYMMPLGLHHIFAWGHHYGPEPWCEIEGARPDWLPTYYHRADKEGLGFDRTTDGSDAVSQYPDSLAAVFNSIDSCPDEFLLWFHHVPWKHEMKSGRTMWDELCLHYQRGVDAARGFRDTWKDMSPYVDAERHASVAHRFDIQASDAVWWKDACLEYFRTFSHMKYPAGVEKPRFSLKKLKKVKLPIDNYTCPSADMLPGF
ncbi:alpha-glucuronidase [Bacteroides sp. ET336]|uniref:alpha-glucuronidase n=1 Tax=Bacteroides sp. ET336 TaxID=2972459 RepID=UPI0021AD3488|nr:alpha-glucuronidase [Bacteroides sp. ET336]MCR8894937.1 alpha-glucuronidase [Bacteroides sp. ET336]MDN0059433.1 alpha-glucuronidase [Bacteroides caecigallinarum]